MRHLTRFGVLSATTTLAGTMTLLGAGLAVAQGSIPWTLDSPSRVTAERGGGREIVVSYDNRSGRDLLCGAYVGTPGTVQHLYEVHVRWGFPGRIGPIASQSDIGMIGHEISVGRGRTAAFAVADGASGPVAFVREGGAEEGEDVLVPAPPPELTDTSFRPEVVTVCAFSDEGADGFTYAELEKSAGGGDGGGLLGSLAGLTPVFWS